jgi:hypothetical protein
MMRSWKEGSAKNADGEFLSLWLGNTGKWERPSPSVLLKWLWNRKTPAFPPPGTFPIVSPKWSVINSRPGQLKCTWIGHATCFLQLHNMSIIADPVFSERCSPVSFAGPKRYTPPACTVAELPSLDLVLISHNHYDHLDWDSIVDIEARFKPVYGIYIYLYLFIFSTTYGDDYNGIFLFFNQMGLFSMWTRAGGLVS